MRRLPSLIRPALVEGMVRLETLLLGAQDGVDRRAGRPREPGQRLLREEDHGVPVLAPRIEGHEVVETPEDTLVDREVERLEQPLVQHANLADEEAEERFGQLRGSSRNAVPGKGLYR